MIKTLWKFHKLVVLLMIGSAIGIVTYFISYDMPILYGSWDLDLINKYFEVTMNISLSVLISCLIFVITSFLPIYNDTNRYLKSHLSVLKEIRAILYHILEPLGRKYELTQESSTRVYIDENDLYDIKKISEYIKEKHDISLNLEIDKFIRDGDNPIKFYESIDTKNKNINYMCRYISLNYSYNF